MDQKPSSNGEAKSRLIGVARSMIVEDPEKGFSMRDLIARAGISSKTAYRIFSSKDFIIRDLLLHETDDFMHEARAISSPDALADLYATIRLAAAASFRDADFTRATQACLFVLDADGQTALENRFAQLWLALLDRMIAQNVLEQDTDLLLLSRHLSNLYIGSMRQNLLHRFSQAAFEAHLGYGFSLACGGVARPEVRDIFLAQTTHYGAMLADQWDQGTATSDAACLSPP